MTRTTIDAPDGNIIDVLDSADLDVTYRAEITSDDRRWSSTSRSIGMVNSW